MFGRLTGYATPALALLACAGVALASPQKIDTRWLERSYWIHASLTVRADRGYWGATYARPQAPTAEEIKRAAHTLCDKYGANRLYLIMHNELTIEDAERCLLAWHAGAPRAVQIVPTFVLRMYDHDITPVYTSAEIHRLCTFAKTRIGVRMAAVYDVYPRRNQGACLATLREEFPNAVVRVCVQPGESLEGGWRSAVEDTWSAMCEGRTNADWASPGFGKETLLKWIGERSGEGPTVAWDLIAIAWDYKPTARGTYPGYDDASLNMPLPAGRNALAADLVLRSAEPARLAGFSSDLFIVQANSLSGKHDGPGHTFYEALRSGQPYTGFFAEPLNEIATIYHRLARGQRPLTGN